MGYACKLSGENNSLEEMYVGTLNCSVDTTYKYATGITFLYPQKSPYNKQYKYMRCSNRNNSLICIFRKYINGTMSSNISINPNTEYYIGDIIGDNDYLRFDMQVNINNSSSTSISNLTLYKHSKNL